MTSLYTKDSVIGKLWNWFSGIFSEETKPVARHLFELALSVLALDGFQSVKSNFERFMACPKRSEQKVRHDGSKCGILRLMNATVYYGKGARHVL